MTREITYNDLLEYLFDFEFYGRHQNPNGLKYYLLRKRQVGKST